MYKRQKQGFAILMAVIMVFALTGCGNQSLLSAKEPVELTMWHVYGEQAGSPMDTLVEEFNRTEGKETVSYTHLDVYKRQPYLLPVSSLVLQ